MEQVRSFTKYVVGILPLVIILLLLGACGSRVVSGNENAVIIESGPWYPLIKAESMAESYCEHYDRRPSYQGGHVERGTLWYIYYFNCEGNSRS